jgi:hypothetical protein
MIDDHGNHYFSKKKVKIALGLNKSKIKKTNKLLASEINYAPSSMLTIN